MNVTVNGEARCLEDPTTIDDLIGLLQVAGRYAVEVNGEIIPKSIHRSRVLNEGDKIEVVQAIGGG